MTAARRDAMAPREVLDMLMEGNERFARDGWTRRDLLEQARVTAAEGQHPVAAIVACIDSRVPVELLFDLGLGDVFVSRMAGAVVTDELLGGLEFATELAGSKLVLVLGHTACGAVGGAVQGVELGHLTGLLAQLRPAVEVARAEAEDDVDQATLVDAAVAAHVRRTVAELPARSEVLSELVDRGALLIAGAVKDLATGRVTLV